MAERIDFERHWRESVDTYRSHPTSRHRQRFVMNALRALRPPPDCFVFDYGCGAGIMLEQARDVLRLRDDQLGGCDTSPEALEQARKRVRSPHLYCGELPALPRPCDVIICSEVVEHVEAHERILRWARENLVPGGVFILTTAGGTLDPPDAYYGHVHHFQRAELYRKLRAAGFDEVKGRAWGFPLFTLQKWLTKAMFRSAMNVATGPMSSSKKCLFALAYCAFFVHDLIPWGPQLFFVARRKD